MAETLPFDALFTRSAIPNVCDSSFIALVSITHKDMLMIRIQQILISAMRTTAAAGAAVSAATAAVVAAATHCCSHYNRRGIHSEHTQRIRIRTERTHFNKIADARCPGTPRKPSKHREH